MSATVGIEPPAVIWPLINAHVVARCVHVVAELGVADALGDEPADAATLAALTQADPDALHRMLRLLSAHGVFAATDDGFVHTAASRQLREDEPGSARPYARMIGTLGWRGLSELLVAAQTGQPKMSWQELMDHFAQHPEEASLFHSAMASKAAAVVPAVVAAFDFSPYRVVADIGGGRGHLLQAVLDANPDATGVLFELPHAIDDAADVATHRLRLVAGDFFEDELPAADAYVLMEVLHDWSDERATRILQAIRRAASPGAKLVVVETLVAEDATPDHGKVLDIIMLSVTGGRERTESQYAELLDANGFRIGGVVPTPTGYAVLEATAV